MMTRWPWMYAVLKLRIDTSKKKIINGSLQAKIAFTGIYAKLSVPGNLMVIFLYRRNKKITS